MKFTGREFNTLHAGLGAKGYDVVAYAADGKATPGSDAITADHGGVQWRFASRENRDRFLAGPERYAPQYGGFCAWGVANGRLFDVDPVEGWQVIGDKLYLNFNREINATFAADAAGFIAKAERHWPALDR